MAKYSKDLAVIKDGKFYSGVIIGDKDTEQKNIISKINDSLGVTKTNTICKDLCYSYKSIKEINLGNVVRINAGDCYNLTPYRIDKKQKTASYKKKTNYSIKAVPFDKRAKSLELRYTVEGANAEIQRFSSCTTWNDNRDYPLEDKRWRRIGRHSPNLNQVRVISDKVLVEAFDNVEKEEELITRAI